MSNCLKEFNALPTVDEIGALTYIDGDSKGCRILQHCPHITFEAEEDTNGLVKCSESKGTVPTDLFTEQQLGIFQYASGLLDLGMSGIVIQNEACSSSSN
jgi:hypothetical protein